MKLSISRAWNDAMGLVQANMGVVAVMAGVFFFLPNLAIVLLMPDMATSMAIEPGTEDPAEVLNQFSEFYAGVWVPMLLVFVAQAIGTLAMLALLRGENRPTVGEALGIGAVGLLTYIGATILVYIALGLVIGIAVFVHGGPLALLILRADDDLLQVGLQSGQSSKFAYLACESGDFGSVPVKVKRGGERARRRGRQWWLGVHRMLLVFRAPQCRIWP